MYLLGPDSNMIKLVSGELNRKVKCEAENLYITIVDTVLAVLEKKILSCI